MLFSTDDTIVAMSSAGGVSTRGLIRMSGGRAWELAENMFQPKTANDCYGKEAGGHLRYWGGVWLTDKESCPAQMYVFRQPASYTGEDMIELHLPGSPVLLQMVLGRLLQAGARMARPGEFTARAFFNGRLDLSEAEAVAEVVSARSDAQLRGAQRLLNGALRRRCEQITAQIAEVLALVEAQIDFSDQDLELTSPATLRRLVAAAQAQVEKLLAESVGWEELSYLPQVVLAGPVNAGKSSLANALLGIDRSIVNAMAGTTRDVLTAPMRLKHGECLLEDTAGLGPADDILAEESQELARQAMARGDLLLWVIDVADQRSLPEINRDISLKDNMDIPSKVVLVANKIDLCREINRRFSELSEGIGVDYVAVSALRGDNLDRLKEQIEESLHGEHTEGLGEMLALTVRQKQELAAGVNSLSLAYKRLSDEKDIQAELAALELRTALDHLGVISGTVVTGDILERIFSRFCVGK
ncbi:MAG: hypothetical protein AMJ79_14060 [Phycisphaerae bacterium SM23_30]|nr:MAG: hypothetical protein AMJ79_14060 [Phycisphaerae bacterium SM23_30]